MSPLFVVLPIALGIIAVGGHLGAVGILPRNPVAGVRVPATMRSDAAWRAGHAASRLPAVVGLLVTGAAAVFASHGDDGTAAKVLEVVAALAALAWVLIAASRAASRA